LVELREWAVVEIAGDDVGDFSIDNFALHYNAIALLAQL
jgi:hypothetical protein